MPNSRSAVVRPFPARRRGKKLINSAVARTVGRLLAIESLENRQLLSMSVVNGWTEVDAPSGARVVHVSSSSGNDGNAGSASSPVRSLDKGISMLRSGTGDQLLLKRGDSWSDTLGFWTKSGKSSNEPLVIGAYGSGARPRIDSGNRTAFSIGNKSGVSNIAIIGIHLRSSGQSGQPTTDGIQVYGRTDNLLIEDVKVERFRNNIVLQKAQGSINNVRVRRSVIVDAYSANHAHSQGLYAEGVGGLLLEENVFDHNGFTAGGGQTMFNHNAYVTATTSGLVARGNVFANASSHGLQARPGGTVENNVFINNAVGLTFGLVNGSPATAGGVTGRVTGNVFVGAKDIGNNAQSLGMEIGNIRAGAGAVVSNNVLIDGPTKSVNAAINLQFGAYVTNPGAEVGINDLRIENNIVDGWGRGIALESGLGSGGARALNNLGVRNNVFQDIYTYNVLQHNNSFNRSQETWSGNTYHTRSSSRFPITIGSNYTGYSLDEWRRMSDGGASGSKKGVDARTISGYAGSASAFLSGARNLSSGDWDTKYTGASLAAYIRSGYLGGGSSTPSSTPSSPTPGAIPAGVPSVSIGDISNSEGDSATKTFTFTVRLSAATSKTVTVAWETKTGTAIVGRDYKGVNSTLSFSPGQTSKTISVQVIGDNTREADEKFNLNLLSSYNAGIVDATGVATIKNDD